MRKWYKCIPPKVLHEQFGLYQGIWMPQMDRYWESDDGYTCMSRQIKTAWGVVEHLAIQNKEKNCDLPWAVKQEIKDELFGFRAIAIEVFPAKKNLVDVCDVYHLWVLPKDFSLPFGLHPFRDPQCDPIERGYDYNLEECRVWLESPERNEVLGDGDKFISRLLSEG